MQMGGCGGLGPRALSALCASAPPLATTTLPRSNRPQFKQLAGNRRMVIPYEDARGTVRYAVDVAALDPRAVHEDAARVSAGHSGSAFDEPCLRLPACCPVGWWHCPTTATLPDTTPPGRPGGLQ